MQIIQQTHTRNSAWRMLSAQEMLPIIMKSLFPLFFYLNDNILHQRTSLSMILSECMRDSAFSVCGCQRHKEILNPVSKKHVISFQQRISSCGLILETAFQGS